MGPGNRSAIGTLVERRSRFLVLVHLPDGVSTAQTVRRGLNAALTRLPAGLRRTLTWDQGKELAEHREITAATGARVFFCDPHSPWQRGTNENMKRPPARLLPEGHRSQRPTPPRISPASLSRSTIGPVKRLAGLGRRTCSAQRSRPPDSVRGLRARREAVELGPSGLHATASRPLRRRPSRSLPVTHPRVDRE